MPLKLQDIIDIDQFQMLLDRLSKISNFTSAIIDNEGNILTASGWKKVCTKYHRQHPECQKDCIESDQYILDHVHEANPTVNYKCPRGLEDIAAPIIIDGVHYANFFVGQFFREPPDMDFYRAQAKQFGFDEKEYLEAVEEIPIWTEEQLHNFVFLIKEMIDVISDVGMKRLKEIEYSNELSEAMEFNQQIINSVRDGLVVYGPDMKYRAWNPEMERFTGVPADKVLGRRPNELFPFLDQTVILDRAEAMLRGGAPETVETPFHLPHNNKTGWVSDTSAPLKNRNGDIIGVIGMVRDITERVLAEEEIRKSNERIRKLYSGVSVGIILKAATGEIVESNEVAQKIFNMPSSEIQGKTSDAPQWQMCDETGNPIPGEDHPSMITLRTGKPVRNAVRGIFVNNAEKTKWLLINTEPIIDHETNQTTHVQITFNDISELRKTQEKLTESETVFRNLFDSSNDAIFIREPGGNFLEVNATACERYGYTRKEFLAFTPGELDVEEDAHLVPVRTQNILDKGSAVFEAVHRKKDGEILYVEISGRVIDFRGQKAILSNVRDLTERKKAEAAIRQSEENFKTLYESVSVGVVLQGMDGVILRFNKMAEKILKMSASSMGGKTSDDPVWQMIDEDGNPVQGSDHPAMITLRTGKGIRNAIRGLYSGDPDKMKWLQINTEPVRNPETGEIMGALSSFMEITELRAMQESLRISEEKYRTLFESMNEGVAFHEIVYGPGGNPQNYRILDANKTYEIFTGISREAVRGKLATQAYNAEDPPYLDVFSKVAETGEPINFETYFSPMGKHFRISIFSSEKGHFTTVFSDITQQKHVEEKERLFREQDKLAAIGKVAGKMAHDFNNVLGITLGTSELLLADDLPHDIRTEIEAIRESAVRGREITQNLLFFAKDQELKYSQIDLNREIGSVVRALRSDLNRIKVQMDFGAGLDQVTVDEGLLNNALINLIQNAIHALSKTTAPVLSLRTARENREIIIEIRDNGCGIPEEHFEKIFDPSFSLKGSMDRDGAYSKDIKGSGYGLANVKRAVDKHGGTITLESSPGQGAAFRIGLPVIDAELATEDKGQNSFHESVVGKRILIVEDEVHFGNILYRLLRKIGHRVSLANTGEIAMDLIAENQFDAFSIDLILPDMNGFDIYRKIRETDREVPVIFVSGNFEFMQSMIDLKKEDIKVDHIAKPFDNIAYVNKIHDWLK